MRIKLLLPLLFLFIIIQSCYHTSPLPDGFVYLNQVDSSIQVDLKYITSDNFVGSPISGYNKNIGICTKEAAYALKMAQKELQAKGWSLIVFDAYRPQKAVNHFMKWATNIHDTITKSKFYPNVDKEDLFKLHYIASKSSHSRGSTFDVSLIDENGHLIDMGTPFDYFGPQSWPSYEGVSETQKANRMYLQSIIVKYGFMPYQEEWWHFTLKNEAFPDTYFDFDVE